MAEEKKQDEEDKPTMFVGATGRRSGGTSRPGWVNKFRDDTAGGQESTRFSVYEIYDYAKFGPQEYFQAWDEEDLVNPWFTYLLDFINNQLFANYHFEGKGAPAVEKYWRDHNMYNKIWQLGRTTLKYGTGIAQKIKTNLGGVKGLRIFYTPDFKVDRDERTWDEKWKYSGTGDAISDTWKYNDGKSKKFVILRPFNRPETPWGFAIAHQCYHALQSLYKITIEDIPAGAENFMTIERVIRADFSNYVKEEDKLAAGKTLQENWSRANPAKGDIRIIDNHHELGYMGSLSGGTPARKLEHIMSFIEPLMSVVLLNYYMAIGIIRQDGANKSLIKRQEWKAFELMQPIKKYVAEEIIRQFIEPHVIKKRQVYLVHDPPYEMWLERAEEAIALYQGGIVPREWAQSQIGFNPEEFKRRYGTSKFTYVEDIEKELGQANAGLKEPKSRTSGQKRNPESEKGSDNDSATGTKREKQ